MSKGKWVLAGVLVVWAALSVALAPASAEAGKKNTTRAKGLITAIDPNVGTVTIVDKKSGAAVTVTVDDETRVRKNKDKSATLADLVIGDKAKVRYKSEGLTAKRIRATSPKARGEIVAIDFGAQTVTIQSKKGGTVTVLGDADTRLKRNKTAAELADLQVGDRARAKYDWMTMVAARIWAKFK